MLELEKTESKGIHKHIAKLMYSRALINENDISNIVSIISRGGATPAQITSIFLFLESCCKDVFGDILCSACLYNSSDSNLALDISEVGKREESSVSIFCAAVILAACDVNVSLTCVNVNPDQVSLWDIAYKMNLLDGNVSKLKNLQFNMSSIENSFIRNSCFMLKDFRFYTLLNVVMSMINPVAKYKVIKLHDDDLIPSLSKYSSSYNKVLSIKSESHCYLLSGDYIEKSSVKSVKNDNHKSISCSEVEYYIENIKELLGCSDSIYREEAIDYATRGLALRDGKITLSEANKIVLEVLNSGRANMFLNDI